MRATPQLTRLIEAVVGNTVDDGGGPTLGEIRAALLHGIVWSDEGELLYAQDTTSYVLELDDLIDRYGIDASARHLVDQTLA